ncbi:Uncharacterised protein [Chlamydia abortus]|nr:Uncharacterised protein [Chlamydia abortus]
MRKPLKPASSLLDGDGFFEFLMVFFVMPFLWTTKLRKGVTPSIKDRNERVTARSSNTVSSKNH